MGLAGNGRNHPVAVRLVGALKDTTHDAFLSPGFSGLPFSVGCQAGQFGAGPRAAWGSVIGATGGQHEIAAMVFRLSSGCIKFDMVDVATLGSRNIPGLQLVANAYR